MPKVLKVPDYSASERQTLFHTSKAKETLYGGAAGGGKTAAIVAEAVTTCLQYPGISVYIFRRTIPELKKTIVPEIRKQCADYIRAGHMTYKGLDRVWEFSNGSTITLAYCQNPGDELAYQGAEIQLLIFDELTHFTLDQYDYLKTRLRDSTGKYPLRVMAATNPGGVGHGWVRTRFIDVGQPEKIHIDDRGGSRIFIPAKVSDHPSDIFKQQYTQQLQEISDPALRKALLEGDWNIFAGQVFTEWRTDLHTIEPFTIPEHWTRWFSYDHGYNTYASGSWFAKDPTTDRTFKYRELYVTQHGIREIANQIKMLESGEKISMRLADPAIWKGAGDQNTGDTVAQMFLKEGINFQPANNDRMAGKSMFHKMLSIAPDGLPWLQYFTSCVHSVRTIPSLPYDRNRVEDVDTKAEDHIYDSDRYGLVAERPAKQPKVYTPPSIARRKAKNRL